MKLSTKGRYAMVALVDIALQPEGRLVTLGEISQRQDISLPYLEQLFVKLRRAELVASVRGPGGGYRLARETGEIRVSDIILAVDEPLRATRCSDAKGCLADGRRCITHDLWDELGRHIYLYLSSITLDDVLERRLLGTASGALGRGERAPARSGAGQPTVNAGLQPSAAE